MGLMYTDFSGNKYKIPTMPEVNNRITERNEDLEKRVAILEKQLNIFQNQVLILREPYIIDN